jgi:HlyD family secretion protein
MVRLKPAMNRTVWIFGGVACVAALVYGFWPEPVLVEVATVARGPIRVTVDDDGKTRVKERYVISTPLAGHLQRIEWRAGDAVEAGKTLLAVVEPGDPTLLDVRARAEAEARLRTAEASLMMSEAQREQAREAHALARHTLDRAQELATKRTIAAGELDAAEHTEQIARNALRAAEFSVAVAGFEIEQARAALVHAQSSSSGGERPERFEIRSPVSGRVLKMIRESAGPVAAGTELLELGNPAELEIEVDVLSADAVRVKPGAEVIVERWGGEEPLAARVRLVEPAGFLKVSALGVEEQRVNVIADIVDPVERRATLGDGYRIEARIVVGEAADVLRVRSGALFRRGDEWSVFRIANGRAEQRTVRVGLNNGIEAEILEGLEVGDQVVLHPGDRVLPGVRVTRHN